MTSAPSWWHLACALCSTDFPGDHDTRCSACGGPVLATRATSGSYSVDSSAPGIWQYATMLGLPREHRRLSLGESMTPLVEETELASRHGVGQVLLKLDYLCPTGSFKDRAVAAGVAHAVQNGRRGLVCASSGNAAASAAAYAARAGLPVVLVMPEHTPTGKLAASGAYGAHQLLVRGDYSRSFAVAEQLAERLDLTNVTTTYMNPHGVSALRSVAYDLFRALGEAPDAVIVPTSAGPLVSGVVEGFADLLAWGKVGSIPKVYAAQPEGCSPVAKAWAEGTETVEEWGEVTTGVSGLDDPLRGYAGDGTVTLRAVRNSSGAAVTVPDVVADEERRGLAENAGVHAEPAGAMSVAALGELRRRGMLSETDQVVCLLTGSGLKRPLDSRVEPRRLTDPAQAETALAEIREELGV